MKTKYSERLGFIDDSQIQEALNKFRLGTLEKALPIREGLFGQNFFVTTNEGEFVFRGCPHYEWQFSSEKFFADNLYKKTSTPVPYPYILDMSEEIFGWSYVIMPKMPGVSLTIKEFVTAYSLNDQRNILNALVECLVKMQTFTWEFPGKYDLRTNTIKPFENGYLEFLLDHIESRFEKAKVSGSPNIKEDQEWAKSLVAERLQNLTLTKGVCVMQDFKLENLALKETANDWVVSGLFDLMELYIGYGESDLARTYCMLLDYSKLELGNYFVEEYARRSNLEILGVKNRLPAFLIVDRILNWEWNQRTAEKKVGFRNWMEDNYL